jgi:Mn-dependent DtxR family transcriptional regulator
LGAGLLAGELRLISMSMKKYDQFMSVERLTVSLESELADAVREAANAESLNVSAWMAQAAHRELASRGLREVIAEWELENGAFTEAELTTARARLRG